jgi:hypothetical protein
MTKSARNTYLTIILFLVVATLLVLVIGIFDLSEADRTLGRHFWQEAWDLDFFSFCGVLAGVFITPAVAFITATYQVATDSRFRTEKAYDFYQALTDLHGLLLALLDAIQAVPKESSELPKFYSSRYSLYAERWNQMNHSYEAFRVLLPKKKDQELNDLLREYRKLVNDTMIDWEFQHIDGVHWQKEYRRSAKEYTKNSSIIIDKIQSKIRSLIE